MTGVQTCALPIYLYRVLEIDGSDFEKEKGDSDTLAGFILELSGRIPTKNEQIPFGEFIFTVESSDLRRVKQIKVTLPSPDVEDDNNAPNTI